MLAWYLCLTYAVRVTISLEQTKEDMHRPERIVRYVNEEGDSGSCNVKHFTLGDDFLPTRERVMHSKFTPIKKVKNVANYKPYVEHYLVDAVNFAVIEKGRELICRRYQLLDKTTREDELKRLGPCERNYMNELMHSSECDVEELLEKATISKSARQRQNKRKKKELSELEEHILSLVRFQKINEDTLSKKDTFIRIYKYHCLEIVGSCLKRNEGALSTEILPRWKAHILSLMVSTEDMDGHDVKLEYLTLLSAESCTSESQEDLMLINFHGEIGYCMETASYGNFFYRVVTLIIHCVNFLDVEKLSSRSDYKTLFEPLLRYVESVREDAQNIQLKISSDPCAHVEDNKFGFSGKVVIEELKKWSKFFFEGLEERLREIGASVAMLLQSRM